MIGTPCLRCIVLFDVAQYEYSAVILWEGVPPVREDDGFPNSTPGVQDLVLDFGDCALSFSLSEIVSSSTENSKLREEQGKRRLLAANSRSVNITIEKREGVPVALAWLRHQTVPVIPIMGPRKVSQLQDNLASLDLELSAEQLKSLDGATRIEPGFPQSIYDREMVRAVRYAGIWDRLLL
jgi:hypothetical protein